MGNTMKKLLFAFVLLLSALPAFAQSPQRGSLDAALQAELNERRQAAEVEAGRGPVPRPEYIPARDDAWRTWTSGKRKLEAMLISTVGAKVYLRTRDGKQVSIAFSRLSRADRQFIRNMEATP